MSPTELTKEFAIDSGVFTGTEIDLSASTDSNAAQAILSNRPFPDGDIQLGHIAISANTGEIAVKPSALPVGAAVSFKVCASGESGLGVYRKFSDATSAMRLPEPLGFTLPDTEGRRYLLMNFGYSASFSGSASHPIGLLGSLRFGADASGQSGFGIIHQFDNNEGSHDVLADTLSSWRLPRHVSYDRNGMNISPMTCLLFEVDGSFALKIAAQLGWDVNFAKDLALLGVTHNLSARIDASLSATFGFNVTGKYLLIVGREDARPTARLRLSKKASKGLNFGFDLNVGFQAKDPLLPKSFDDFIKTVFGVHGLQVLADVRGWTDPSTDLGEKIAGIAESTALDMLKSTTGIDPTAEFDKAKAVVTNALNQWFALPDKLTSMLWSFLEKEANPTTIKNFKSFLMDLSDLEKTAHVVTNALQRSTFANSPEGQFLGAIADQGILALFEKLPIVATTANQVLRVLDGGVIVKLQAFINQALNLEQIRNAVTEADFGDVNQWLQSRLGGFLDRELQLDDLKDVQKAIHLLDAKVASYYKAGIDALTRKYSVEFAAKYQQATVDTALLDVEFDLSQPEAQQLFTSVVANSCLDDLLTRDVNGVKLNLGVLTHDITRKGTIELHMPFFDFTSTHVNDAVAKLTVENQGGRLLLYEVDAKDNVTVANRAASQLSVLASLKMKPGESPQFQSGGTISYEMRQVKADMRPLDLEMRTSPFVHQYLSRLFGGGDSSLRTFYTDLDNAMTTATGNRSNHLGDVALSMQLSLKSSVLSGWLQRRGDSQLKADQMKLSRALQRAWKDLLPTLYFQQADEYAYNEAIAALLVWSSMPVSTSISSASGVLHFNTDRDVYWNFPDHELRRAVASDFHTLSTLAGRLASIHQLLVEAGSSNASFFEPSIAPSLVKMAINDTGDHLLQSLLFTEAEIVSAASETLKAASATIEAAGNAPSKAIRAFATFASRITETFHKNIRSIYARISDRVVAPMLLVHASSALGSSPVTPDGLLLLYALKPCHQFKLGTFVDGSNPPQDDIALVQTLVSVK
jgi:hypothetical protein